MHRKNRRPILGVLLGLVLGGLLTAELKAQPAEPAPPPRVNALIVTVNGTQKVTMSTKTSSTSSSSSTSSTSAT